MNPYVQTTKLLTNISFYFKNVYYYMILKTGQVKGLERGVVFCSIFQTRVETVVKLVTS